MSNTVRNALAELVACAEVSVPYTALNTAGYRWHDAMAAARAALAQSEAQPVAWCALTTSGKIAHFDGKPMVMVGPVGNEHHKTALYASPQQAQPVLDASWEQSTLRPQQAQPAEPAYVPLSDEDIEAATEAWWRNDLKMKYAELCRAIESLVVARMRGEGK